MLAEFFQETEKVGTDGKGHAGVINPVNRRKRQDYLTLFTICVFSDTPKQTSSSKGKIIYPVSFKFMSQ